MIPFNITNLKCQHLVYYFITYSFLGWCIEVLYGFVIYGKYVARGSFDSPFCPIYGFGAMILIIFLNSLKDNRLLFFISSVILNTMLEFGTGVVMRYAFNVTAWDYSDEVFNLLGIVCLKYALVWGLLSVIMIYYIHPIIEKMLDRLPYSVRKAIVKCLILYSLLYSILKFRFL